MVYATAAEVRSAIDFPSTGAPISDTDIESFIQQSEDEVNNLYKTYFKTVDTSGTATSGSSTTLTLSTASWTTNRYQEHTLHITGGTGSGQYRRIISNTDKILTVSTAFTTNPDATSTFEVLTLGYKNETLDGSGNEIFFTKYFPLDTLISVTIDSTSVTPSNIYQYSDSGKLILKTSAEVTKWSKNYPQLINLEYTYGIDHLPQIIKRLTIILTALRTLSAQIAGTYDDFTSISLPGVTASKGEPYTNIRESINKLQSEAKAILCVPQGNQLEARGWNSYAPFTVFG